MLARHRNVTVDFITMSFSDLGAVLHEKINCALPVPFHEMHPVSTTRRTAPPHFVSELAELRIRLVVETHVLAERFRVETPASTNAV